MGLKGSERAMLEWAEAQQESITYGMELAAAEPNVVTVAISEALYDKFCWSGRARASSRSGGMLGRAEGSSFGGSSREILGPPRLMPNG